MAGARRSTGCSGASTSRCTREKRSVVVARRRGCRTAGPACRGRGVLGLEGGLGPPHPSTLVNSCGWSRARGESGRFRGRSRPTHGGRLGARDGGVVSERRRNSRHRPGYGAPPGRPASRLPGRIPNSCVNRVESGSPTWARTRDLQINSLPLYQLSYRGAPIPGVRITTPAAHARIGEADPGAHPSPPSPRPRQPRPRQPRRRDHPATTGVEREASRGGAPPPAGGTHDGASAPDSVGTGPRVPSTGSESRERGHAGPSPAVPRPRARVRGATARAPRRAHDATSDAPPSRAGDRTTTASATAGDGRPRRTPCARFAGR